MSIEPSPEEQDLLADTFRRVATPMSARERVSATVAIGGFALATAGLWSAWPPHGFSPGPAVLCVLVLVLAMLVKIDTTFGFTVPTQLAFVPLLFSMPVALVPIAVAVALAIAYLPDVFERRMRPSRLLHAICNAWFAIGPVAVFTIARVEPRAAGATLLLAALGAQFATDFAASTIRLAISRGASLKAQLRESWVYVIDAGLSGIGLLAAEDIHSAPVAALALVPLLGLLAVFARERRLRLESLIELNNAYRGTALLLGDVVEADDGYTGEHARGVLGLALAVAQDLGLSARRQRNLEFAALLHDVGKIAIPKQIINKPGKLDAHEWTIIKTHTVEGQRMLERVGGFMRQVGAIVRAHHERYDGSGYPDGLSGEQIPLESRIIACCDAWNAMRTDRAYRKALSHQQALAEIQNGSGSQFDPHIVEALLRVVEPAPLREPQSVGDRSRLRPALNAEL